MPRHPHTAAKKPPPQPDRPKPTDGLYHRIRLEQGYSLTRHTEAQLARIAYHIRPELRLFTPIDIFDSTWRGYGPPHAFSYFYGEENTHINLLSMPWLGGAPNFQFKSLTKSNLSTGSSTTNPTEPPKRLEFILSDDFLLHSFMDYVSPRRGLHFSPYIHTGGLAFPPTPAPHFQGLVADGKGLTTWSSAELLAEYGIYESLSTDQMLALRNLGVWALNHSLTQPSLVHSEYCIHDEVKRQILEPLNLLLRTRYFFDEPTSEERHNNEYVKDLKTQYFIRRGSETVELPRIYPHWGRHCEAGAYTHGAIPDFLMYLGHTPKSGIAVMEIKTWWALPDHALINMQKECTDLTGRFRPGPDVHHDGTHNHGRRVLEQIWGQMHAHRSDFAIITNGRKVILGLRRDTNTLNGSTLVLSKAFDITDNRLLHILFGFSCAAVDTHGAYFRHSLPYKGLYQFFEASNAPVPLNLRTRRYSLGEHFIDYFLSPIGRRQRPA